MNNINLKISDYELNFFNIKIDLENQTIEEDLFQIHTKVDIKLLKSFLRKSLFYMKKIIEEDNLNSNYIDILESYEYQDNIIIKKNILERIAAYLLKYDTLRSNSWVLSFVNNIENNIIKYDFFLLHDYLNIVKFIYFKFSNLKKVNLQKKKKIVDEINGYSLLDVIYDNYGEYYPDNHDIDFWI